MHYLAAFLLVAIATMASCESMKMLELTPSRPRCEVSLWCQDYETADRCEKVDYCRKWIWTQDQIPSEVDVSCSDCKEVVGELLSFNKTAIDFICDKLPFGKSECKAELAKLISNVTPQEICHSLKMCNASDVIVRQLIKQLATNLEEPESACSVCQLVAEMVLENADSVKGLLEGLCNKTAISVECDVLVDAMIEELKKLNSTQICTDVKLCSAPDQSDSAPQLLGADMCTRGPAYWCASLDNAKECQAFEFCEKKIWI